MCGELQTYPSCCEEGNVQANEEDHGFGDVVIMWSCCTNDSCDELGNNHSSTTDKKNLTASKSLNDIEGEWRRQHVDQRCNERNQKRVFDRLQGLEKGGTEIEDEVDTSKLLGALKTYSKQSTAHVTTPKVSSVMRVGKTNSTYLEPLKREPVKQFVHSPI